MKTTLSSRCVYLKFCKYMQAVLHNIRSVYNVASMFRTADGLGVETLYLTGYTPEPTDRFGRKRSKFKKVALGAEEAVRWETGSDVHRLIVELQNDDAYVIACEPVNEAETVSGTSFPDDTCLVFGNEVDGLPDSVIDISDQVVKIPMQGKKSSLNVAVAFGVITKQVVDV